MRIPDTVLPEQVRTRRFQQDTRRESGVFQEEPVDVAWKFSPKAAPDAREYVFHPDQTMEELPDGSLIVRFWAGGRLETGHLHTWRDAVEVLHSTE